MKISFKFCLKVALAVFLLYLCILYWQPLISLLLKILGAASPLVTGFVIAYIVNILMSAFERFYFPKHIHVKALAKSRRAVCLILAIVTLCGIIALIIGLVIPELISCLSFLVREIPPIIEKIIESDFVKENLPEDLTAQLYSINWTENLQNIAKYVVTGIGGVADIVFKAVTSVFSAVFSAFISIIFAIYILIDRDRLICQLKRLMNCYLPRKIGEKIDYVGQVVNLCFHRYIVGQCTEAVILGVLCTIGMWLFRFPYAAMIGALIGFTALIPIAGAYIGAAVGAIMILTESPLKSLLFIVFIIVLQQIEGNLIYPKVVGKSIGLPALWVLAAVTVGGGLFGIIGMLVGVPITAAIYRLLRHDVHAREHLSGNESTSDVFDDESEDASET